MGNCVGLRDCKSTPDRLKGFHHMLNLLFDDRPSTTPARTNRQTAQRPSIHTGQVPMLHEPMEDVKLHYEMGEELGRGQFGLIRLCKSKLTGERFACKSIAKARLCSRRDVDNVRREIAIMKQLKGHPNIVELKAVYEDPTAVHLVMELCEGGELFEKIDKKKPYSEKDAAEICKSLMEAVQYCHSRGIIHRDLKPENILLMSKTCPSQIKVADFGLAVNVRPGDQKISGIAGSAYYIAPEVLKGKYSTEVDVWSSGVILYILLCGLPPFWDTTEEGIFEAIRHSRLDLDSDPWPKVSSAAKDLIQGMLCPDIKKRFTTETILSHKWIVKHTQTSKSDQSSSLQQYSLLSHTSPCFNTSLSASYSIVSEESTLANLSRNDLSLPSSLGASYIRSTVGKKQLVAIASQEGCKSEDREHSRASDEGGLLSEAWTSFMRLLEHILHELSGACVSKVHKDMPLISTTISQLQTRRGFKCTLLEATNLKETAIVGLGKENFLLVLDRENDRVDWKYVEEKDVNRLLRLSCSSTIRVQAQPQSAC
ncbi:hypothetical protein O6H91_11G003000 [Diphasiastrum complanatum]|uniref:Uncharacterized protein n=1 Tax=Diphasiastrum complanatum TaxID=34168 RepID=A0ACC2C626_DIPCM|nr:hypothetical protein O6H91_11G003000 [Diphasiastrum complanatum]